MSATFGCKYIHVLYMYIPSVLKLSMIVQEVEVASRSSRTGDDAAKSTAATTA